MVVLFFFMIFHQGSAEALLGRVYFDVGGSELTPGSEAILKGIANKLRAELNLMIDVNGYTDNVGSAAANAALSKKRADQAKDYLANNLRVAGDRINTAGLGAQDPIASNKTEQGRQENRRVEIVIREPDALLVRFENDVKVQPPAIKPGWLDPAPNYYLYRRYRITTGKKSSAYIVYPDKGVLNIGEDAMVIIHGMESKRKEKPIIKNIELQSGGLETILKDVGKQEDSVMSTSAPVVELYPDSSKIVVDEKLKGLVSVYQSNAVVSAAGKEVRDTVVEQEEVSEEPGPSKPQLKFDILPGEQEGEFIIVGHTDTDVELYINDEKIKTDKDGSFSYTISKDYQSSSVLVRAVSNAGNTIERKRRIPPRPAFRLGVNVGLFSMGGQNSYNTELGYCCGLEFASLVSRSISFYLNTGMGRIEKDVVGSELYRTVIIPFEFGFRKEFDLEFTSPFFNIGIGFVWWQNSLIDEVVAGDDRSAADVSIGLGVGTRVYLSRKWFLNLQANYTHFFNDDQYSFGLDNANTVTRYGLGMQYGMQ